MKSYLPSENAKIQVSTSGRLHMGFFDLHGGLGRKFGSIGLSLSSPSLVVEATYAKLFEIKASTTVVTKAVIITESFMAKLSLKGSVALTIQQNIPQHSGLGSGTQLALAIGRAISELYALNLTTAEIAQMTGRGVRSGIGIAAFDKGGLLIDGGRAVVQNHNDFNIPPLLARYEFPAEWRILLISDSSLPGMHGDEERLAFEQLPEFPEDIAAHLCRQVLMRTMPALVEQDLNAFGQSIQFLQSHVGDYFAPAQGGRYASKKVGAVLEYLERLGVSCFGQSSWGPTGFAVFENMYQAEQHLHKIKAAFMDQALSYMICSGNNQAAIISQLHPV